MMTMKSSEAEKVNIEDLDEDQQKVFRVLVEAGTKVLEQMEEGAHAD